MLVKTPRVKPWPVHEGCVSDSMTTVRRRFLRTFKTDVGVRCYNRLCYRSHLLTGVWGWAGQTTYQFAQTFTTDRPVTVRCFTVKFGY